MSTTTRETARRCPGCGGAVQGGGRFVVWCAGCDWNVDPAPPEEDRGRLGKARRALARRHGEQLLAEMTGGAVPAPRRDPAALAAYAIALLVHGVTVLLAAGGTWFLVTGWGRPLMAVGVFLLALAWTLRPRPYRLPEDGTPVLARADAPELYALIDEVAGVVGSRGADLVVVDGGVNASVTTRGVRGRRVLTLGLPLWEILTPQQRIALLGHEFGHYSNGDARHDRVLATACRSLTTWRYYFAPTPDPSLLDLLVNLLSLPPRAVVHGALALLDRLSLRATQRAEYLADSAAARAGSTDAAVGLMDRLLVADSVVTTLRREGNAAQVVRRGTATGDRADGLWERLAAETESIPEDEYERQRRVGALRGHSVDSTHPPTHLRRACLLLGDARAAAVTMTDDRAGAIAAELAGPRRVVARHIVRQGFPG
ncbi:M48 family metallopeptidase [Streptomyces sp. CA-252508]|uniref:M48 family metallopeptidase n=1 Tax=Streptomyces sp. CA-252508 TaxID=3418946 RepID=UPI003D90EC13